MSSDAPPSYESATHGRPSRSGAIPTERRRSMEDELRPLPEGWIRQYDPSSEHQFFVDTTKEPPRSIWCHPLDDEEYLNSLAPEERDKIRRLHRSVSLKDIEDETTDEEGDHHASSSNEKRKSASHTAGIVAGAGAGGAAAASSSSAGPSREPEPTGLKKYGRRMKDKLTSTTHEQRERERAQRAKEEQEAYQLHMAYRRALTQAMRTGEPQYLGKDQQGRSIYIEPPNGPMPVEARIAPGGGYIGYNPYRNGPFAPDARFVRPMMPYARPAYPYARPYGYGYGAGYGFPLMGAGAGLLGGALLGAALF